MSIKEKYIWHDGKAMPFNKVQVHFLNHSLHYGSAVFEGIRCYKTDNGSAVFRLRDHVDRLFHSAITMGMNIPFTRLEIIKAIRELVRKNKLEECYIRPLCYYGDKMGLLPIGAPLHVGIAAWGWGKYLSKDSVKIKISPFTRIHPASSKMTAKISGHYANSIIATLDAKKSGYDEALLLDYKGNIAEGPGENIFFVKNKTLITPKANSILPGITRDSIKKIAVDLGYKIIEKDIKPKEIKNFDEAFFVGTAVEVNAVGQIDKVKLGNGGEGAVTKTIKEEYLRVVHGKNNKYKKWLDFVK